MPSSEISQLSGVARMLIRPGGGTSIVAVPPAVTSTLTLRRRKYVSETRLSVCRPDGIATLGVSSAFASVLPFQTTSTG